MESSYQGDWQETWKFTKIPKEAKIGYSGERNLL